MSERVAEHFADLEQQRHAARFGMWCFISSESLFFLALFALYTAYRVEYPVGFRVGVLHNTFVLGSINTAILLTSSFTVASAVYARTKGHKGGCLALVGLTIGLGFVFLAIKFTEYAIHFHDGIYPGGSGRFFVEHREAGTAQFWTLYYAMTGLHVVHMIVGIVVLAIVGVFVAREKGEENFAYRLELAALYWSFVDVIWVFIWPLFYLIRGSGGG